MRNDSTIYDSIIISSCLFGSVYIFSNSIKLLNDLSIASKQNAFVMNSRLLATSTISGSVFIYGILKFKNITK